MTDEQNTLERELWDFLRSSRRPQITELDEHLEVLSRAVAMEYLDCHETPTLEDFLLRAAAAYEEYAAESHRLELRPGRASPSALERITAAE